MNKSDTGIDWIDLVPIGLVYLDPSFKIINMNQFAEKNLFYMKDEAINRYWHDLFPTILLQKLKGNSSKVFQFTLGKVSFIAKMTSFQQRESIGVCLFFQYKSAVEEFTEELESYQDMALDLKAVFDTSNDLIYVSDAQGKTLRVSAACEKIWGYKESDLVGKTVFQLEEQGVFKPSVTRLVLEKQEKVSLLQTTKTGRRLLVVGMPMKDSAGNIIRVVNASRDVTEVNELQTEVDFLKRMTESYKQEIENFRIREELEKKIISRSGKMKQVVNFSQKIAKVDSTVLLLGESGVGKEVIASFIHKWSNRSDQPFVTLNCASMHPEVLEAELFGFREEGNQLSSIKAAESGTLFLEQIDEMPLSTQTKFLKTLQGGNEKREGLNVRIITASNNDLGLKVADGSFRKDLYYKLNVVPIMIPPLRERKEDVIPLVIHFTDQLNKKYGENKKFQPLLLKRMQDYSWPGNVEELQNIVERLFVTSEGNWIELDSLPDHMQEEPSDQKSVTLNKIIPLKEAVELVERELIEMAVQKYGSTTKVARALEVDQSTISRKIQRYKNN